ncbi:hypothetical protein [Rhizobium sp. MHM7A]|uniref:hypothetical protein n=1 Tax=Rhizobium sp. MHM7A TaxID=2583233 RepID=UPI00110578E7|nr:hypothetical protein [Rhizobium sp. MHM7A]TLX16245.1 hypothetical protein FFR93_02645 [Rhizobium sp. MHM7A]
MTYKDGNYPFYGRVVRQVEPDSVLWICSGLHIHIPRISDLAVQACKGRSEYMPGMSITYFNRHPDGTLNFSSMKFQRPARFLPMPSLRRMRQLASCFHGRDPWKTSLDYQFIRHAPTLDYPVGSARRTPR